MCFRMDENIKTQLVSAIYLQEVELEEQPADNQQDTKNNNGDVLVNNQSSEMLKSCGIPPLLLYLRTLPVFPIKGFFLYLG